MIALAIGVALTACVAGAAQPFPAGYTLNDGHKIAFRQALPRSHNAATGRPCDWYNIKHLAIPGVATGTDPSLAAHILLPTGRVPKSVWVNGVEQAFAVGRVDDSSYVDFTRAGEAVCDIEILFR